MVSLNPAKFITDPTYREKIGIPALARALRTAWNGMALETRDTFRALGHILSVADGRTLTTEEKQLVKTQLQDLAKSAPMLAVFMLPGGMLLLPILLKVLPFDLRLSAFKPDPEEEAEKDPGGADRSE